MGAKGCQKLIQAYCTEKLTRGQGNDNAPEKARQLIQNIVSGWWLEVAFWVNPRTVDSHYPNAVRRGKWTRD